MARATSNDITSTLARAEERARKERASVARLRRRAAAAARAEEARRLAAIGAAVLAWAAENPDAAAAACVPVDAAEEASHG